MKRIILTSLIVTMVLTFGFGNLYAAEELSLLTWKGYAPKDLVEKFQKETDINVKVTYSNNEEMIAKLRATRGAGFDLAQPSQDRISSVQEKYKIYQPIDLSKIQAEQIIEPMLEAVKKNTMVAGKPYAVPFCWGCRCGFQICQNCMLENQWGMTCNGITWQCPDCGDQNGFGNQ